MTNTKKLVTSSILVALGTFALSATSAAQVNKTSPDRFSIDHIMQMKTVRDLTLSPDGNWVAYTVSRMDEDKDKRFKQIFISSIDGETTIPMTASYTNASSPQWSPDGKYLSFLGVRGKDDKAKAQVWLLDRRGGEAQQYTKVKQGVNGFLWAPNGQQMVLTIKDPKPEDPETDKDNDKSNDEKPEPFVIDRLQFKKDYVGYLDRRRTHFYLFDGTNDPVQITSGDYDDSDPKWSPDSQHIAFVSKREGDPDANDNSDIWIVKADKNTKRHPLTQLTTNPGPDRSPAWSADGASIAYVSSVEPEKLWYATDDLAIVDVASKSSRLLSAEYDRMISNPMFDPASGHIYAVAADGGNRPLISFDPANGTHTIKTPGDLSIRSFDIAKNGQIAVLKSNHEKPYEVFAFDKNGFAQVSDQNKGLLDGVLLGDVERLNIPGWNDENVESFVYYPPRYNKRRKYPTIFLLHGGPVSQHDTSFEDWARLYAAQGYIAVLPNPHGSSGYGQEFSYALNRQWGVPDFADVDAIATHLVNEGISDEKKLGVGGWSYGGILTNYVITKSNRFAGAVTGASEVNHRANYGHDIYQHFWEVELGLPWEDIDAWESMNPFNDLGKVTTPTLVMGGQLDWNVPIQNSEQLYQVLKRRGIETQLVVYPDEYHGISRPSFVRDRLDRYLAWYDKYVK